LPQIPRRIKHLRIPTRGGGTVRPAVGALNVDPALLVDAIRAYALDPRRRSAIGTEGELRRLGSVAATA
jgi:hypothetical protein